MANKAPRRIALRRKIQILRTLTKSNKSGKKSSITADTLLYIHKLSLQLEAIKKECHHLINNASIQEVKVEKVGKEGFLVVRVRCNEGEEVLPSILQVFEQMDLSVVEATVCCKHVFHMEAIVKAATATTTMEEEETPSILNKAILNALHNINPSLSNL